MSGNDKIFLSGINNFSSFKFLEYLHKEGVISGGTYLIHSAFPKTELNYYKSLVSNYSLYDSESLVMPHCEEIEVSDFSGLLTENEFNFCIDRIIQTIKCRHWTIDEKIELLAMRFLHQAKKIVDKNDFNLLFFIDIPHDPWEIALSEYCKMINKKVWCFSYTGLNQILRVVSYPNFDKSIYFNHSICNKTEEEINKFLLDEVEVNWSTYHLNSRKNNFFSLVLTQPLKYIFNNLAFFYKTRTRNYFGYWFSFNKNYKKKYSIRKKLYRYLSKIYQSLFNYIYIIKFQYNAYYNLKNINNKSGKILVLLQTRPEATQFPLSNVENLISELEMFANKINEKLDYPIYYREHPNMFKPGKNFCRENLLKKHNNLQFLPMGTKIETFISQKDIILLNTTTAGIEQSRKGINVISLTKNWWSGLPRTHHLTFLDYSSDEEVSSYWEHVYMKKAKSFLYLPWFYVDLTNKESILKANDLSIEEKITIKKFSFLLVHSLRNKTYKEV